MFEHFPDILEVMGSLRYLYLDGTAIRKLPSPIENLNSLSSLELRNCSDLCISPDMILGVDNSRAHLLYLHAFCTCRGIYYLLLWKLHSKVVHHQARGFSTTIQLPSHWANSKFWGFALCAVIISNKPDIDDSGFQVKCRYHFKNEYGDCDDLYGYFGGPYGIRTHSIWNYHTVFGHDPCVNIMKDDRFSKYNAVVVEFYTEDMNGHPVPINVVNCGVRILYAQEERFCRCPSTQHIMEALSKIGCVEFPAFVYNILASSTEMPQHLLWYTWLLWLFRCD
ncbi:hypothetical protein GH714_001727 [Hevea brasiliensis]|uniref:C-JID domain-containing protein n=1 Tax=Hevea brasiliensis TaxID=3981 RepID=A0A6A6MBL3_HEVBR|nr:hypothetical protein GH714_001727 [Hevea brasiliensis]